MLWFERILCFLFLWDVILLDTLYLKCSPIINTLVLHYNGTDDQCCSISIDGLPTVVTTHNNSVLKSEINV